MVDPAAVSLDAAHADERGVLASLIQLYAHDFSEFIDVELGDDGRFAEFSLDAYWVDEWRHPFLIRCGGKLAGFALVHARSHFTGAAGTFDMAEFFVARGFRRRGVGKLAAFRAFDRFRGSWEVRQRETNVAATAFWRSAIGIYTRGAYEDSRSDDHHWVGPVQRFRSVA